MEGGGKCAASGGEKPSRRSRSAAPCHHHASTPFTFSQCFSSAIGNAAEVCFDGARGCQHVPGQAQARQGLRQGNASSPSPGGRCRGRPEHHDPQHHLDPTGLLCSRQQVLPRAMGYAGRGASSCALHGLRGVEEMVIDKSIRTGKLPLFREEKVSIPAAFLFLLPPLLLLFPLLRQEPKRAGRPYLYLPDTKVPRRPPTPPDLLPKTRTSGSFRYPQHITLPKAIDPLSVPAMPSPVPCTSSPSPSILLPSCVHPPAPHGKKGSSNDDLRGRYSICLFLPLKLTSISRLVPRVCFKTFPSSELRVPLVSGREGGDTKRHPGTPERGGQAKGSTGLFSPLPLRCQYRRSPRPPRSTQGDVFSVLASYGKHLVS